MMKNTILSTLASVVILCLTPVSDAQISVSPYVGYNLAAGLDLGDLQTFDMDDRSGAFLIGLRMTS